MGVGNRGEYRGASMEIAVGLERDFKGKVMPRRGELGGPLTNPSQLGKDFFNA